MSYPPQVGVYSSYDPEEVKVYLDRPVVTDQGTTNLLDYQSALGFGYIYSMLPRNFSAIPQTTQRGTYTITGVDVSDTYGHVTHYSTADLARLGFSTGFTLADPASGDLDGDGLTDIVFHSKAGTVSTWFADQGGGLHFDVQGPYNNQGVDPAWTALETFNFTGPSSASILWRNKDGSLAVWCGSNTSTDSHGVAALNILAYNHAPISSDWSISATGDFDGDGKGDLLWRNADGALSTWSATVASNAPSFSENTYFHDSIDTRWKVEGAADFTGDGRADILWRNDDGSLSTWTADQSGGFTENSWFHGAINTSWHVVGLGDFNADGLNDILWRNDNGALSVWTSNGTGFVENQFNASAAPNWQVAQVGDYNKDGKADVLWRNTDGAVSIWESSGSGWAQNVYYNAAPGADWSVVAHHFLL